MCAFWCFTPSLKVVGRLPGTHGLKSLWAPKKGGQNSMCCRRAKKNRGQKSICGHKKGGQYSMSHWKIGVKILCSKSWEGQNSMKAKIWGSKFIFFSGSWNPWSKFYVPWKGGSKGGSKPRSLPTNFTEGVPQDLIDQFDDKPTLFQVMAWCHHARSHYLNLCSPRSQMHYCVIRPQWV